MSLNKSDRGTHPLLRPHLKYLHCKSLDDLLRVSTRDSAPTDPFAFYREFTIQGSVKSEGYEISCDDLLELTGRHLIEAAYRIFLGRAPDASGLAHYMTVLGKGGRRRRQEVIYRIGTSVEATRFPQAVRDFGSFAKVYRRRRKLLPIWLFA